MLPREPRRVEVVAERGADAADLVGGDLLALAAAAEDDPAFSAAVGDRLRDRKADRRVVDRFLAVRAVIVDRVAEPLQGRLQMFLEQKPRMIGADRDAHGRQLYYGRSGSFGVRELRRTFERTQNDERTMTPTVVLSTRGELRLRSGHPWIYRADVADVQAAGGDRVVVRAPRGRILGYALYSDRSQIAVRMLSYGERPADDELLKGRIDAALAFRRALGIDATAYRLIHGEADLLPSLIVDRYGDYLVVQTLSQGMDRLLPQVVDLLNHQIGPRGILARNDPRARLLEGLDQRVEVVAGEVPDSVAVREAASSTTSTSAAGRRPGCFSTSGRTAKPPPGTRAAGCSIALPTTADLLSSWRRPAPRRSPWISRRRRLRG